MVTAKNSVELYVFTDALEILYCAVVHVRMKNTDGFVHTMILFAKA